MTTDDDLPARLRAAARRWTTARGVVRHWRRQDLVTTGFRRRAGLDAAARGAAVLSAARSDPPSGADEHGGGEVFESVLAVAAADSGRRRRADAISRIGEEWLADSVVVDGSTFWARTGGRVDTNAGDPHVEHGGTDFIRLLLPDEVPDGFDLTQLPERETVAGRPCDVVVAVPRPPDPYGEAPDSEVFDMISGGDTFRLSVDRRVGVLLRVVKLVDDQTAEVHEFLEIALDEPLDDSFFEPLS